MIVGCSKWFSVTAVLTGATSCTASVKGMFSEIWDLLCCFLLLGKSQGCIWGWAWVCSLAGSPPTYIHENSKNESIDCFKDNHLFLTYWYQCCDWATPLTTTSVSILKLWTTSEAHSDIPRPDHQRRSVSTTGTWEFSPQAMNYFPSSISV